MTGLVLKLKPNEKVLINGVMLQNCDRAAKIRVRSKDVSILRASDAIEQDKANTPLRRIYYIAQLALAGEADMDEAKEQIESGLQQLKPVLSGVAPEELDRAASAASEKKFFVVMRALKKLFALEESLLTHKPA